MLSNTIRLAACFLAAILTAAPAFAQIDARMLRYPAVSRNQIAFVYAGDIWLVNKTGGPAVRLTSSLGEESFPRFSPDGGEGRLQRLIRRQRGRLRHAGGGR